MNSANRGFRSCRFEGRIEGVKAFSLCGFEQGGRGRDKDNLSAVEHIAGDNGGGELKRFGPTQCGAIEELTRRLKDAGIKRPLNHAGSFNAESIEGGGGVFGRDVSGAFGAANGGVDL